MLKQSITYFGNGVQVTSGAASATQVIPNTQDGKKARYVALFCPSGYCYARPVESGGAATANDIPVVAGAPPVIISAQQFADIAYIQGTAAAMLNIIPVEF